MNHKSARLGIPRFGFQARCFNFDIQQHQFGFGTVVPPPPPVPDISSQSVARQVISGQNVWNSNFDWAFSNNTLKFSVDIKLAGDIAAAQQYLNIWETGIERIWSDGATIIDGANTYDFLFDVNFVQSGEDYVVNVFDSAGRGDMTNWYLDLSGAGWAQNMHDEFAAHEFGHMLGLYDEYFTGAFDPNKNSLLNCKSITTTTGIPTKTGAYCDSLMADLGPTQQRYYDTLLAIFEGHTGRNMSLAMAPVGYYNFGQISGTVGDGENFASVAAVPLPNSLLLFTGALALLGGLRVRRSSRPLGLTFRPA